MTVAIVSNGEVASTDGAVQSETAPFPSGHTATAGRLLLAFAFTTGATGSFPLVTPAGYTQILNYPSGLGNKRLACYVKKAVGGETGVTVTQSGGANTAMSVHLFEISGADVDGIIAGTVDIFAAASEQAGGAGTTIASTSINPTSTDDVLFLFFVAGSYGIGSVSWSNSFVTETSDTIRSIVGSRHITNPGATTTTATYTSGTDSFGVVVAIPTSAVGNTGPTADAGVDQVNIPIGSVVSLDGSGSSDVETPSTSLTYAWAVTDDGGTGLTTGDIASASSRITTLDTTGAIAGTLTVTLTVTDAGALDGTDTMTVNLVDIPAGSINGWVWDGSAFQAL